MHTHRRESIAQIPYLCHLSQSIASQPFTATPLQRGMTMHVDARCERTRITLKRPNGFAQHYRDNMALKALNSKISYNGHWNNTAHCLCTSYYTLTVNNFNGLA